MPRSPAVLDPTCGGAQIAGRATLFRDYRLRIAEVVRDYGMKERREAPADSGAIHG
jgi:hypothetical protein